MSITIGSHTGLSGRVLPGYAEFSTCENDHQTALNVPKTTYNIHSFMNKFRFFTVFYP